MLGDRFWQRHFNSDPGVIGKTIQLVGNNYTVVGVAASRFTWDDGDVYLPLKVTNDPVRAYDVGLRLRGAYPTWKARQAYFGELHRRTATVPGVTMTAISSNATPPDNGWQTGIEILGELRRDGQQIGVNFVSPGYFPLLRIPVVQGKIWDETEITTRRTSP
jgi:MacB-like periplasmic core domain